MVNAKVNDTAMDKQPMEVVDIDTSPITELPESAKLVADYVEVLAATTDDTRGIYGLDLRSIHGGELFVRVPLRCVESAVALALAVHGIGGVFSFGSTRILFSDKIYMHKLDLFDTGNEIGQVEILEWNDVFQGER